jgi:GTP cyclohydrolase I
MSWCGAWRRHGNDEAAPDTSILDLIAHVAYKMKKGGRGSRRAKLPPSRLHLAINRLGRSLALPVVPFFNGLLATLTRNDSMNDTSRPRRPRSETNSKPLAAPVDQERIRAAVREILLAVGENPDREGLKETPDRVARMYAEIFSGMRKDPREPLKKTFTEKYDEMVLVKNIGFESFCEHHMLPFIGKAHIAYLPNGKIVGLSKLARVVEILARRPQVQERMTEELADLLMDELDARGVGVILEATHTCMTIRGVRKADSVCTTSAMRGGFKNNQSTRAELMALILPGR